MISRLRSSLLLRTLTLLLCTGVGIVAQDTDNPIVNPAAGAKFGPVPNAPACFTIAVEKGDPSKGPSVILARFAPQCVAPYHWHTPSETAMVESGTLETIRNYRERVRRCEELAEYAMSEQIREILMDEQDHQIALATALSKSVPQQRKAA